MPSISSIGLALSRRWPEALTPSHQLPNESRVVHVARVALKTFAIVTREVTSLALIRICLSTSLAARAIAITGFAVLLFKDFNMGSRIIAASVIGAGLLYTPGPLVAGAAAILIAHQVIKWAEADLDSYTIGKLDQKLTAEKLEEELQAIANSNRKIKSLTIYSQEKAQFNLSETMYTNLQKIQPDFIHCQNFKIYSTALEDLNKKVIKRNPNMQELKFYYFSAEDLGKHTSTLKIEKLNCANPLCLKLVEEAGRVVFQYFKQLEVALESYSSLGRSVQVNSITLDYRKNDFQLSSSIIRVLRKFSPKQISIIGKTSSSYNDFLEGCVRVLNPAKKSNNNALVFYHCDLHHGTENELEVTFQLKSKEDSEEPINYTMGHPTLISLNERDIQDSLKLIPSGALSTLSISSKDPINLTKKAVEEIKRIKPKKIELVNCSIPDDLLLDLNKGLNADPNAFMLVLYKEKAAGLTGRSLPEGTIFKEFELKEFGDIFEIASEFEAHQFCALMENRLGAPKTVKITCYQPEIVEKIESVLGSNLRMKVIIE